MLDAVGEGEAVFAGYMELDCLSAKHVTFWMHTAMALGLIKHSNGASPICDNPEWNVKCEMCYFQPDAC